MEPFDTKVLPTSSESLALASRLLHEGKLVAFPTETVYGLGANAFDRDAVLSIFKAKGRPADNPLIVHIFDTAQLQEICTVPPLAYPLMEKFWPGPLTILMPKKPAIPDEVTASLETVAVRMPSHPVARALLQECGLPIAAPSANRSGKPSPTSADYVYQDMAGRIPLIIDGGDCDVGVESTVIDVTQGTPCILRPGGITPVMLESVLGKVNLAGSILRPLKEGETVRSPGMKYKHYAPSGQVTLVEGTEEEVVQALQLLHSQACENGHRCSVLCFEEHMQQLNGCSPHNLGHKESSEEVAHNLFHILRKLDDEKMNVIFSEVVPAEGVGLAVMNRLGRAAAFRTLNAHEVLEEYGGMKNEK